MMLQNVTQQYTMALGFERDLNTCWSANSEGLEKWWQNASNSVSIFPSLEV